MRNIYITVCVMLLGALFASCEKSLPVYDHDECYLRFKYESSSDSLLNRSFVYTSAEVDTVWLDVQLMGNIDEERDRPFTLKQVKTGINDAVAGVQFVDLNDPGLVKDFYYIPKGEAERQVPIILRKTEAMDTVYFTLKVAFESNDEFGYGSKEYACKTISVSNQVSKPKGWDTEMNLNYYLGTYGKEKHKFMIRVPREKWDDDEMIWDDNYMTIWNDYISYDSNYCTYVVGIFKQELAKLTEPLYEENGDPVTFP